jgi:uncharacterized protein
MSRRLVDYRYWLLAAGIVLGVAAAIVGERLTLDRSIETMFAEDDPILVPYRRMQRTFGEHEVVLAVYADDELKSLAGLERMREMAAELRAVPGVVAVVSLLDPPGADDFEDGGRGQRFREMFVGYTHNEDFTAAGALCLIERPGEAPPKRSGAPAPTRRETLAQMRAVVAQRPQGALVGEPVLVEEAFDLLEADGRRLNTWCTLLVLLTILVCFRDLRWLVLPLAVVQLTLALTNASLVLAGLELSMVSSMLGAIVTVVGVATVVHIMVRYQDKRRAGADRRAAMIVTFDELRAPIVVAILTDAAGFAALMVSRVGPVHDFGLMMAVGSLLVLPACVLLAPGVLWLADPGRAAATDDRLVIGPWLQRVLAWANRHVLALGAASVALIAVAAFGARRLEHETDFTANFRDDSSIVRAYDFVETEFGGAGVWSLLIPAPDRLDPRALVGLLSVEHKLRAEQVHLNSAISISDGLSASLGGPRGLLRTRPMFLQPAIGAMRALLPEFVNSIFHEDPQDGRLWLHVLLRSPERLEARQKDQLIEAVEAQARETYPEAEVTGYYVLMTRLIESVLADQWRAFVVAALAVLAMMLAAIRNVRLALVTLLPSIFPSLVLFGAMGWLGVRVNMGAAMIAAVSVGLSVDGSIHYTMFYQRLRRQGLARDAALASAQDSVGRAALFATLALTIGFATLVVSDFVPTIYFGALVSLSMIGGLIGNLVVLPVLIRLVDSGSTGKETARLVDFDQMRT